MRRNDYPPVGMMTKTKIKDWIKKSANQLSDTSEYPFLEVQVILASILHQSKTWLASHPEDEIKGNDLDQANELLKRISTGEPLSYLTGKQAFFGLDFIVSPDVLIPRPETEILVEECIQWLESNPDKRTMADIGTGSGIIAVTLADHFEDLQVTAIDISKSAIEIAKKNAAQFHIEEQISFLENNLLEKHSGQYYLIAANLPYIPTEELRSLPVAKYEPFLALDGGIDGLDKIKELLGQCSVNIRKGGLIILEIQFDQSASVVEMAKRLFPDSTVTIVDDLAKHPRIIKIQM
jgi:release factor glutamine methyltransferase